jgi:hypothetical protein
MNSGDRATHSRLAHNQGAVVVLQSSADDFRGARRVAVDQHYHGVFLAAVAASHVVALFAGSAPIVINDELVLREKVIRNVDRFLQQTAGIVSQVEDQPFQVTLI